MHTIARQILTLSLLVLSGAAMAKKPSGDRCASLLLQVNHDRLVDYAAGFDGVGLTPWQRQVHFEQMVAIANRLSEGVTLEPGQAKMLANFRAKTVESFEADHASDADAILEFLSIAARSDHENLLVGSQLLRRYLEEAADGPSERGDALFAQMERLLTSVSQWNDAALDADLKAKVKKTLLSNREDFAILGKLITQLEPEWAAAPAAAKPEPAPAITKYEDPERLRSVSFDSTNPYGTGYKPRTIYKLDDVKPTPVTYDPIYINRFNANDLAEGFGDHGLFVRPGARVEVQEIFVSDLEYGPSLPGDVYEPEGRHRSVVLSMLVHVRNLSWDADGQRPIDLHDKDQLQMISGGRTDLEANMIEIFVSPSVLKQLPAREP